MTSLQEIQFESHGISASSGWNDLPLAEFNQKKFPIYVIDYNWAYLFANTFAIQRLNGLPIAGKSIEQIWAEYPGINFKPLYNLLKPVVANRTSIRINEKSPVTGNSIEIIGFALSDCYYFSVSDVPEKQELISELKRAMKRSV